MTTVVVGNCSFSLYPTAPRFGRVAAAAFLGALLGETAADEVFDGFSAYRDALHRAARRSTSCLLVGHAALRLAVMGYERRAATAAERATMQAMLARQLADGAAGLSLGLVYPPSAYADEAELVALAGTVQAHGKLLAAHIRSYEAGLLAIDRTSSSASCVRPAAPGCCRICNRPAGRTGATCRRRSDKLEAARRDGVDVSFDMYPYPAGSSYVLQLLPPEALEGGLDGVAARSCAIRTAARRCAALVEEGSPDPNAAQSKIVLIGWGNVRISGTSNPTLKRFEGKSMDVAAAEAGITPFDLMVRFIEEDAGQTAIVMFQLDEDDLHAACTHRLHMFGSDGLPRPGTKPHPRAYGTFPRVAGRLRREAAGFRWRMRCAA